MTDMDLHSINIKYEYDQSNNFEKLHNNLK